MGEILRALGRAFRSLGRRGVLLHLLWPSLVSVLVWSVAAAFFWTPVVDGLFAWVQGWTFGGSWVRDSEIAAGVALVAIKVALALVVLPLIYVTAALLVAVIALPLMVEKVALQDYSDLEMRRGGSNFGSVCNAGMAGGLFLVGMVVSLPLWLIPGGGLVVSVILTAWLNQRAFGYDALMLHADRAELARMPRQQRAPMLLLGGACALFAYVPLVNIVAPAFCGLAFVHFMLEALRRERVAAGVTILEPVSLPQR